MDETIDTVERVTLLEKSVALFNSLTHTHTLCLLNNKKAKLNKYK